jgi:hypothetical protein
LAIDKLPDDVLLEIFDHHRGDNEYFTPKMWKPLVHVCQRWRNIVFASPQTLHLRLVCDVRTPARKLLNIWPPLPIVIRYSPNEDEGEGNVIAALEHYHRICWVVFKELTSHILERFTTVMQEPFLVLTGLRLQSLDELESVIPDTFMGGYTPQLQIFVLEGIAFPALPRFVSSATHLTKLQLQKVPDAGYVSPEAMGTCLSVLPELKELIIGFQSPQSRPRQITAPPLTRVTLPALTYFEFRGVSEYLEDLIARIITPKLDSLDIYFFLDLIFVIPQLNKFISITNTLKLCKRVYIELYPWSARITIESPTPLHLRFKCDRLDWRVSSMARLCGELFPHLSEVELLAVNGDPDLRVESQEDTDSTQWLELFRPFTAVQSLFVSKKLGPLIAQALQELTGDRVAEVLPSLQSLSLGGFKPNGAIQGILGPFFTARQLSGHHIIVKRWEQDPHWDRENDD